MLNCQVHDSITQIPAAHWNRLAGDDAPFLRHEFLAALERHGCVGERFGWIPQPLALYDAQDRLVAAAPAYLKFNSYGEFVFDWAWADAYQRAGLRYYPKLVIASPYTPATGPRLLLEPGPARAQQAMALIDEARQLAERLALSGVHWLFGTEEERDWQNQAGYLARLGCQFHWHHQGEADFDALLARFSAAKRKNIKRERRRVQEAGVHLRRVPGDQVTEAEWVSFHRFYQDTFERRGGIPTLSLEFFQDIAASMGEQLLLIFAEHQQRIIAAAFCLLGARSLYGRHWGCAADFHGLHFEACYYQGLEHCLAVGLERFEPGAQGEHKLARGFLPTPTWSTHWIADPRLRQPIAAFLTHERAAMRDYLADLRQHSPYKSLSSP